MFKRVLVANRGEIALRVIRACRDLGIETVVGYSTADAGSLPVRLADRAVRIGPPPAKKSYLQVPNLIGAAIMTGADAIHPGYGFLSEDPDFSEICQDNGIVFIGSPPEVMRYAADKAATCRLMEEAGLPRPPGTRHPVASLQEAERAGGDIGYPLLVKAVAGGGGRGISVVRSPRDLRDAYRATRETARAVFGNDEVYLERYVPDARHIEVQVLRDGHGGAVHLGERECSIQRRHQKLVEEAPAPSLEPAVREALAAAALRGAKALDLQGVGTMEFLVDSDQRFWFLEVNPRIQVEHPVTELVTGIDIVTEQIRIAATEPLSVAQPSVEFRGNAVECRVNAEHPDRGFVPTPGRIDRLHMPAGPWIRVDAACAAGSSVDPAYDSLIAKLIAWGPDRSAALDRARRALQEFDMAGDGMATTVSFLQRLLVHPRFRLGNVTTSFLEEHMGVR